MTGLGVSPSLLLILPLLAGVPSPESGVPLKCAGKAADREPPEPLVAIDGELIDRAVADLDMEALKRRGIRWLSVVCMDPRDSTFNEERGVPVLSIWMEEGPAGELEPTLEAVLEAQDVYFRRHSTYAGKLGELELPERSPAIRLSVEAGDAGWVATARIDRLLVTCWIHDGEVADPFSRSPPRRPTCSRGVELPRPP